MGIGSRGLCAGTLLALALAGASPAASGGACDRARSILAERDRVGDIAATRPRSDCAQAPRDIAKPDSRSTSPAPHDIHSGSVFTGLGSDPLAYSRGFSSEPLHYSPGFNPPPPRP